MWRRIKDFLPYFKTEKRAYGIILLALLVIDLVDLAPPLILGYYINNITGIVEGKAVIYLGVILALLYVGVVLVMGFFRRIMSRTAASTGQTIANKVRRKFFIHLETLPPSFYNKTKIGDLMSRATTDIEAMQKVFGFGFILLFDVAFNIILLPPLLFYLNWSLALYILPFLPAVPIFVVRVGEVIHRRFERVQKKMADISAFAQEHVSGVRVVKAYAQEPAVRKGFDKLSNEYAEENIKLARWTAMFFPMLLMSIGIASSIIIIVGGNKVLSGEMQLGHLIAYLLLMMRLMRPMMFLGWVINLLQRGSASMKRIKRILDTKPDIEDTDETLDIEGIEGEIEFRNCSFSYNGTRVLKNINLKITNGETVAIVGHVGSGKSTLVNLLARLVNPNEGEVFIDGTDIRKIPLSTLRTNIGFVPQEIFLFSTSIIENIRFGREEVAEEDVIEAANISRLCNDLNELPDGYETLLGEKGVNLSGGQKQRVAIARGVILNPKILILDDALSSVDADTEREILKGLKGVMRDRTSIVISHRLSSIKDADRIIVLENGCILEQGPHRELMRLDGIYARMYRVQQLEKELE